MRISARDKKAAMTFNMNSDADPSDGYGVPDAALKRLVKHGLATPVFEGGYQPTTMLGRMCDEWEAEDDTELNPSFS